MLGNYFHECGFVGVLWLGMECANSDCMKNQLIPLTACDTTPGEYEPTLVPHGFKYRQLVKVNGLENSFHTKHDHQGFSFRKDLDGLVHRCSGMPIIEIDDGGLFAVKNADKTLLR